MKKRITVVFVVFFCLFNISFAGANCSNQIGNVNTFWACEDMKVVNTFVYAAAGKTLTIVDVTITNNPYLVTNFTIPGNNWPNSANARAVEILGNTAYILDNKGSLHSIDVTYPQTPTVNSTIMIGDNTYDSGQDLFLKDGKLYAVCVDSGLHVIDLATFSEVADFFQPNSYSVAVVGDYAYIGTTGIRIVNLSTTTPTDEGFLNGVGLVFDIVPHGSHLFIANSDLGVVDISIPTSPSLVHTYPTTNLITLDVEVSSNGLFAYISSGTSSTYQIEALDISTPTSPIPLCDHSINWNDDIQVFGSGLVLMNSGSDFRVVEFTLPPVLTVNFDSEMGESVLAELLNGDDIFNCTNGSCTAVIETGDSIDLTAYPKAGYIFDYWDNGVIMETNNPMFGQYFNDMTWTAVFEGPSTLNVTVGEHGKYVKGELVSDESTVVSCGDGASICSGSFLSGTEISLVAYADSQNGYMFRSWSNGGDPIYENPTTITIADDDETWVPTFVKVPQFSQNDEDWACDQLGSCSCDALGTCSTDFGSCISGETPTQRDSSGCGISSFAMVYTFFGEDTDPGKLNLKFQKPEIANYSGGCLLTWDDMTLPDNMSQSVRYYWNATGTSALEAALLNGEPVIARVNSFHYVVIIGKVAEGEDAEIPTTPTANTYRIIDPWTGNIHYLNKGGIGNSNYNVNYFYIYSKDWNSTN